MTPQVGPLVRVVPAASPDPLVLPASCIPTCAGKAGIPTFQLFYIGISEHFTPLRPLRLTSMLTTHVSAAKQRAYIDYDIKVVIK